jgi:hypothetical protein
MARTFAAIPSIVLVICVFLPALRVCGDPTAPIAFPPCYAAYFGGLGIALVALARRRALVKLGASISIVLAIVTVGGTAALCVQDVALAAIALAAIALLLAIFAVRAIVRSTPRDGWLAVIALLQGVGSTIWAVVLAFDKNAMWGATVTLFAALGLVVAALAWLREHAAMDDPPLPAATLR